MVGVFQSEDGNFHHFYWNSLNFIQSVFLLSPRWKGVDDALFHVHAIFDKIVTKTARSTSINSWQVLKKWPNF
jgi:hypothetical protein